MTPTPALSTSSGAVTQTPPAKRFRLDSRYVAPLLISCILLAAQLSFGVLESYPKTLLAIVTCIVTEIALSKFTTGRFPHLASAYVSGISIGILVRSPEFWPYALCALIAITSKYVIRWKGRHLWNPSNFAIAVMLLIAHDVFSTLSIQWDNRVWAMAIVWMLGSYIIWNLKRFHICATYVASFVGFAALRALMGGGSEGFSSHFWNEVAPITGPMYQLFIFFMITDPKTTVGSKKWQCVVVFFVAFAEHILRLNQNIHAPYYALFTVGPIANAVDIWWHERQLRHHSIEEARVTKALT
ncbi:hypothetical protein IAD21_02824 [Abditibacteriota bacterium]|nr:hypothetical protein IAD21_02824 [Abditibacteriota bacterium]